MRKLYRRVFKVVCYVILPTVAFALGLPFVASGELLKIPVGLAFWGFAIAEPIITIENLRS